MKKKFPITVAVSVLLIMITACGNTESTNSEIVNNTQESDASTTSITGSSDVALTTDEYDIYLMSYTTDVIAAHTNMLQCIHDSTEKDVDTGWISDFLGCEVDGVKAVRNIENMNAPSSRLVLHERVLVYCREAIDGFQEISDACGTTTTGDLQLGLDLIYSATQGLDRCVQGKENMLEEPQILTRDNSRSNSSSSDDNSSNVVSAGMYKVGIDIPAGEYKVTPTGSASAYYLVANDSTGEVSSWVTNASFDDVRYVTVKDGQYLTLERCTATLIE